MNTMSRERYNIGRYFYTLSLVITLAFTSNVFALAIVGLVRGGYVSPNSLLWAGFKDQDQANQHFGMDKVSRPYEPGSWAAYLFTVGSCCIDRALGKGTSLDAEQACLMGLNLNIVAAYGYPLIAAIDPLSDIITYLNADS